MVGLKNECCVWPHRGFNGWTKDECCVGPQRAQWLD